MKFYIDDFINLVFKKPADGKALVKFGKTRHSDALDRFNENVDDGYEKNYRDWDIKCAFSWVLDPAKVDAMERFFLEQLFPNPGPTKVWIEKYLGCADQNHYSNCSGITELRLLSKRQRKWVLANMYNMKDGKPIDDAFNPLQEILCK